MQHVVQAPVVVYWVIHFSCSLPSFVSEERKLVLASSSGSFSSSPNTSCLLCVSKGLLMPNYKAFWSNCQPKFDGRSTPTSSQHKLICIKIRGPFTSRPASRRSRAMTITASTVAHSAIHPPRSGLVVCSPPGEDTGDAKKSPSSCIIPMCPASRHGTMRLEP